MDETVVLLLSDIPFHGLGQPAVEDMACDLEEAARFSLHSGKHPQKLQRLHHRPYKACSTDLACGS